MLMALSAFLVVFVMIFVPYWIIIVRAEGQEERALRRRLRGRPDIAVATASDIVKARPRFSSLEQLDAVLRRGSRVITPFARAVEQSGLPVTVGTVLLVSCFVAVVTFATASWLAPSTWVALLIGILFGSLPTMYVRRARRKRIAVFEEQFLEAVELIARGLRGGHALTTTLQMVADEAPAPVGTEFRLLFEQQNYGMSLPEALKAFAQRVPLIDARFFVTALLTQREMGGNLSEVLDNLAAVIRERFKLKRQVRVVSAHGRITGLILGFLPPAVALALFLISPSHIRLLIEDPIGVQMVVVGVALQIIGVLAIRRIVDVEY